MLRQLSFGYITLIFGIETDQSALCLSFLAALESEVETRLISGLPPGE